jgi:hypothetical protein
MIFRARARAYRAAVVTRRCFGLAGGIFTPWVTVILDPPIVIAPDRGTLDELAEKANVTVPLPEPAAWIGVNHVVVDEAVHEQPEAAVTPMFTVPAEADTLVDTGETTTGHDAPA